MENMPNSNNILLTSTEVVQLVTVKEIEDRTVCLVPSRRVLRVYTPMSLPIGTLPISKIIS